MGPERQTIGERTSNRSWFRAGILENSPSFTSNRRRSCLPIRYSTLSWRSCLSHGGSQLGSRECTIRTVNYFSECVYRSACKKEEQRPRWRKCYPGSRSVSSFAMGAGLKRTGPAYCDECFPGPYSSECKIHFRVVTRAGRSSQVAWLSRRRIGRPFGATASAITAS